MHSPAVKDAYRVHGRIPSLTAFIPGFTGFIPRFTDFTEGNASSTASSSENIILAMFQKSSICNTVGTKIAQRQIL